jgi:hypothetical protein
MSDERNVRLTKKQLEMLGELIEESTADRLELLPPHGAEYVTVQVIASRPGVNNLVIVLKDGSVRPA